MMMYVKYAKYIPINMPEISETGGDHHSCVKGVKFVGGKYHKRRNDERRETMVEYANGYHIMLMKRQDMIELSRRR